MRSEVVTELDLFPTRDRILLPKRGRGAGYSERLAEDSAEQFDRLIRLITEDENRLWRGSHHILDAVLERAEVEEVKPKAPPLGLGAQKKRGRDVALGTLYAKGSLLAAMIAIFSLFGYAAVGVVFINPIVSMAMLVGSPFLYGRELQKI